MTLARRPRGAGLCAALGLALLLGGCGDSTSTPRWVSSHRDTALLTFQTTAPGICAITVQYPDDAPAAIGYLGGTYVQVGRGGHPTSPAGRSVGESGDWHVYLQDGGDLVLVTPSNAFDYRPEPAC